MALPAIASFVKGFNTASDTTVATGSTLAVSSGDLLIALVTSQEAGFGGQTITGLTDGTNSFTACTANIDTGGGGYAQIWYKENASAVGSATFTATWSAAVRYKAITVLRVTGAATSSALGAQAIGTSATATVTSGSMTTTADSLLVAVATSSNDRSWTPGAGTEAYDSLQTDAVSSHGSLYLQQTGAGSYTLSNTASSSSNLAIAAAAFYGPAGPTITTQPTAQRKSVGQTASFSASATGATSQRWQSNASGSWADISGETSTTYTTGTLGTGVKYAVRIIFSDSSVESISDPADVWTPSVESLPSAVFGKARQVGFGRYLLGSTVSTKDIFNDVFFATPTAGGSTGTLARTNANDTLSAIATTTIVSTLARTNANDTVVASGSPIASSSLARTNNNDTLSASGSAGVNISGSVNYTNTNDTSTGQATTTIVSSLARTNANDTSIGTSAPVANSSLARTNNNDTLVSSGTTTIVATLTYTNNNDSVSASGSAGLAVIGSVNYTNLNDTSSGSGTTTIIATVSRSNNNDTLSAAGSTGTGGSGNSTKLPLTGAGAT